MDRGWTTICALASSAALDFYLNFKPVGTCLESKTVRTFRCPCVGNRSFVDLYNDSIKGQGLPDWSKLETIPSEPMIRLKTICDLHGPCMVVLKIWSTNRSVSDFAHPVNSINVSVTWNICPIWNRTDWRAMHMQEFKCYYCGCITTHAASC